MRANAVMTPQPYSAVAERVKSLDRVPHASTVHSFCLAYLLRENDHAIGDRIQSIVRGFEIDFLQLLVNSTLKFAEQKSRQHGKDCQP